MILVESNWRLYMAYFDLLLKTNGFIKHFLDLDLGLETDFYSKSSSQNNIVIS